MFGLDRKVLQSFFVSCQAYTCQAVREGVATTFKKLVKETSGKPKSGQAASSSLSSSSALAGGAAGAGALKRPSAEVQRLTF
jgi:hypothetical protein